jgi:hypothetical protein
VTLDCDFWDNKTNYMVVCVYTYIHVHICKHVCVCVCVYHLLYYTGRQIECDFWDNKTNYMVKEKEGAKKEDARLQSFGAWLEDQVCAVK